MAEEEVLFDGEDEMGPEQTENQEQSQSEVVARYKLSPLSLTVFKRETEGGTFYESNLQRVYTRDDGENFEYTSSIRPRDMRKAARLFEKAADKLEGFTVDADLSGGDAS